VHRDILLVRVFEPAPRDPYLRRGSTTSTAAPCSAADAPQAVQPSLGRRRGSLRLLESRPSPRRLFSTVSVVAASVSAAKRRCHGLAPLHLLFLLGLLPDLPTHAPPLQVVHKRGLSKLLALLRALPLSNAVYARHVLPRLASQPSLLLPLLLLFLVLRALGARAHGGAPCKARKLLQGNVPAPVVVDRAEERVKLFVRDALLASSLAAALAAAHPEPSHGVHPLVSVHLRAVVRVQGRKELEVAHLAWVEASRVAGHVGSIGVLRGRLFRHELGQLEEH